MDPKYTLLVVDDEQDVCDSVYDLLRRKFNVLKARGAAEGTRLLQENEVHIVMTDQRMPQITGVDLLKSVRAKHPRAVRMLFTGYADLESIVAAINQGHIFQFLKKPWRAEDLEAAVCSAADEYERLVNQEEEIDRLQEEVRSLTQRVCTLEKEVEQWKMQAQRAKPV
jgi:DNA-binding NtrC family response regulator